MTMPIIKPKDDTAKYQSECINAVSLQYINTDGTNVIAMIIGYKYFTFRFEMLPIRIESNNVAKISKTIIPITSVGPANNGNT